ncbi:MAG TPA: hypothetical protein VGQ00_04595 [Candidatus Norongarragalinales archaeon]|jgi:hypothetical protein|nr:hypothetical protein [Candidatus Norongarragalinales archaeon]
MVSKMVRVSEKEFRDLHVLAAKLQVQEGRRVSLREALARLLKNGSRNALKVHSRKNQKKVVKRRKRVKKRSKRR